MIGGATAVVEETLVEVAELVGTVVLQGKFSQKVVS